MFHFDFSEVKIYSYVFIITKPHKTTLVLQLIFITIYILSKICVRLMGRSNAMELLCFGKRINAEDAKKRNIVTSILPHQNFQEYIQVS